MAKVQKLDPVTIELPEGELLPNGTMSISLMTLEALESFWEANKARFPYSCEGLDIGPNPMFMRPYQWVFGPSKAAVIETVLRLGRSRISVKFYNWKEQAGAEWEGFFDFHNEARDRGIEEGNWSEKDEAQWAAKTRESYHGWWRFDDVPNGMDVGNWFGAFSDAVELWDPKLPIETVTTQLCEDTFEEWAIQDFWELGTHTPDSLEKDIAYWKAEKAAGEDYYGREHEA